MDQEEAFERGFNDLKKNWFKGATIEYEVVPIYPYRNLEYFFQDYKGYEKEFIEKELKMKKAFKLNRSVEIEYRKNGTGEIKNHWYNAEWCNRCQQQYHDIHSFNQHYSEFEQDLRHWIEEGAKEGSDITFLHIKRVHITFAKINILKGGEYIPLPYDCTQSVLNIRTKQGSNRCSLHHILADLYPNPDKKHPTNPFHYEALEYIVLNKDKKGWFDEMRTHIKNATTPVDLSQHLFVRVVKLISPLFLRIPNSEETPSNEEKQLQVILKMNMEKLETFP